MSPQLRQLLDSHIESMFKHSDMGISMPHPQFLFQHLLNKSNKGTVGALYKHLVVCKYKTRVHPNMKHWQNPYLMHIISPSSNLLCKATSNLKTSSTTAHAHKVSLECILAAMRVEKHIVHFDSHPTGVIRKCPVCHGEDSLLHAMVDCSLPSYLWNIYSIMITDIAMSLNLDDRFKVLGVFNKADAKKPFSKPQRVVAYSLACIIRALLYTEYYKQNESPNSSLILMKLQHEIDTLKARNIFFKKWLNNTLSHADLLFQKIRVPDDISYIRTIEQRTMDLLNDNEHEKVFSSHIRYDVPFIGIFIGILYF